MSATPARSTSSSTVSPRPVRAGRIALAGGAVETARLLQLSALGNDWVGDCLQGHTYSGAFGRFDEIVIDGLGPGPSIASLQFLHGNDGVIGGGLLANEFVKLPALHYPVGATTWRSDRG